MDAQDAVPAAVPDLVARGLRTDRALLRPLVEALEAWMPAQRWFAHKGDGAIHLEIVGTATLLESPDHSVSWTVVEVTTDVGRALYQIPLVLRPVHESDSPGGSGAADGLDRSDGSDGSDRKELGARIGILDGPGRLLVVDALRDADGRAAVTALLLRTLPIEGESLELSPSGLLSRTDLPVSPDARSRLLSGEQSNSSIVVEEGGVPPVILKVFRVLQDGENPDVVLQGALSEAGSTRVPTAVGSARLSVGPLRGHALFAQEFLPGVEDAWRTMLRSAAAGEDVSSSVRDLGAAVAEVHRGLAEALGTCPTPPSEAAAAVGRMIRRIDEVAAAVPQVAAHRTALEVLYGSCLEVAWPDRQRIHGDLHLGQVLSAPGRGWVLVDFEGEPLRPLAERTRPDSPIRDVAGMLRSLDYAAAAVEREQGTDPADAARWAGRAREAFLAGYVHEAGLDTRADTARLRVLLSAFEADKAVYEALYEARNRPDWLDIPLSALERIGERALALEERA